MIRQAARLKTLIGGLLVFVLALAGSAEARKKAPKPPFQYAGGTETIPTKCAGNLEVSTEALIFKCPQANLTMPFSSITSMDYRADVAKDVRKLKLHWKAYPRFTGGSHNRFFTVVYTDAGETHVVILNVAPDAMRPYLAEIELKSGKRVEVEGYEEYK